MPILSAIQLFCYSFALPSLSNILQMRAPRSPEQIDWILALMSGIPLSLGTVVIGLSPDIKCLLTGM